MAKKKIGSSDLGRRERQIMDAVHQLGKASVSEIRDVIPDPPSYSSVRTMVRLLESKGLLKHRQNGKRYEYRATVSIDRASKSAIAHVLQTFFGGSATHAVAAILDNEKIDAAELKRIEQMIKQARKEGK